jgi:hypothetical protein
MDLSLSAILTSSGKEHLFHHLAPSVSGLVIKCLFALS